MRPHHSSPAEPMTEIPSEKEPLIGPVVGPGLHMMSWNIRRRVRHMRLRSVDLWENRAPAVRALLRSERPTLLGVQEALPDQVRFVGESLAAGYRCVGRGRAADGGEEGCPIFYDAERLELLDWEQLALSNRPMIAGSISWGNLLPRILVSATFRDRVTSRRFQLLNTHLDHLSARSRRISAQAIRYVVSTAAMPTVLTADMNDGAGSAALRELVFDGRLADTWDMAKRHESQEWGTFANYKTPRCGGRRLDWILASPAFQVDRAAINTLRPAGTWASDHLPVQAVMVLPNKHSQ